MYNISDLEYDIETRPYGDPNGKIYICFFHKYEFQDNNKATIFQLDSHDVIFEIDNNEFHQEFNKLPYKKDNYNNEYTPVNFKTEDDCNIFLKSIGLKRV